MSNIPQIKLLMLLTGWSITYVSFLFVIFTTIEILIWVLIFLFYLTYRKNQNFLHLKLVKKTTTKFTFFENYAWFWFTCLCSIPVKMLITNLHFVGIIAVFILVFLVGIRFPLLFSFLIYYCLVFIIFFFCLCNNSVNFQKNKTELNNLFKITYSKFFFGDLQKNTLKVLKSGSILSIFFSFLFTQLGDEEKQAQNLYDEKLLIYMKEHPNLSLSEISEIEKSLWNCEVEHTVFLKVWVQIENFDFSFIF